MVRRLPVAAVRPEHASETLAERPSAHRYAGLAPASQPVPLAAIEARELGRIPTGIGEFDRVLGGGLVAGQVALIGGDPGIGKSTLLLQALASLGAQARTLYVTGEESAEQVALRARRLALEAGSVQSAGRDPARAHRRGARGRQARGWR